MLLWNDLKCTQILCNAPKYEFTIQCGGMGAFVAKNPGSTSWQVFFALIAPVHTTMHRVSCSCETIPNAPKHYATHQNMSLGSNGVDWVVHCEKSGCGFVARTFAIIAPVHTVLHRVSCSYETITNAPKHNETYENKSLGSNGVDRVGSLRKIPTWLRGTNFCFNCTSSLCFASSFMQLWNDPKCTNNVQRTKTWV